MSDSRQYEIVMAGGWLVAGVSELGHVCDKDGVCFGLATMGVLFVLSDDPVTFDNYLLLIKQLVEKGQLTSAIAEARKKQMESKKARLTDPVLDIPAFIEGIVISHQAEKYPDLFDSGKQVMPGIQNVMQVGSLVDLKKIDELGGKEQIASFTGAYVQGELRIYFEVLQDAVKQCGITRPFAMMLMSSGHAICVGYYPVTNKWQLIDAADLPTVHSLSSHEIADKVLVALSENGCAVFTTNIYGLPTEAGKLREAMSACLQNDKWQLIHMPTKERAAYEDDNRTTWLHLAARENQADLIKALLACDARVDAQLSSTRSAPLHLAVQYRAADAFNILLANHANIEQQKRAGVTPMMLAVIVGSVEKVNMLRAHGADEKVTLENNHSLLNIAVISNFLDVAKALLLSGADPDHQYDKGMTSLYYSSARGNFDMCKLLIEHGADINKSVQGATPLFIAAQYGRYEVCQLLLERGALLVEPFVRSVEGLREFAASYKVVDRMEELISRKSVPGQNDIALTPREIAYIMGREKIVSLLAAAEDEIEQALKQAKQAFLEQVRAAFPEIEKLSCVELKEAVKFSDVLQSIDDLPVVLQNLPLEKRALFLSALGDECVKKLFDENRYPIPVLLSVLALLPVHERMPFIMILGDKFSSYVVTHYEQEMRDSFGRDKPLFLMPFLDLLLEGEFIHFFELLHRDHALIPIISSWDDQLHELDLILGKLPDNQLFPFLAMLLESKAHNQDQNLDFMNAIIGRIPAAKRFDCIEFLGDKMLKAIVECTLKQRDRVHMYQDEYDRDDPVMDGFVRMISLMPEPDRSRFIELAGHDLTARIIKDNASILYEKRQLLYPACAMDEVLKHLPKIDRLQCIFRPEYDWRKIFDTENYPIDQARDILIDLRHVDAVLQQMPAAQRNELIGMLDAKWLIFFIERELDRLGETSAAVSGAPDPRQDALRLLQSRLGDGRADMKSVVSAWCVEFGAMLKAAPADVSLFRSVNSLGEFTDMLLRISAVEPYLSSESAPGKDMGVSG